MTTLEYENLPIARKRKINGVVSDYKKDRNVAFSINCSCRSSIGYDFSFEMFNNYSGQFLMDTIQRK